MRTAAMIVIGLIVFGLPTPSHAQAKDDDEDCLQKMSKYTGILVGTLSEPKPRGECALSAWVIQRHNEILRTYDAEPEECKKTELGKNVERTVKSVIRQETNNRRRRSCK
jgi:hypothetical protein